MSEPQAVAPSPEPPRRRWRWVKRGALWLGTPGLLVLGLLALVVARPALLVPVANFALRDQPVRLSMDSARLEAPFGWSDPSRWRWRIEGFGLVSHKEGLPTVLADSIGFRMPRWRESWKAGKLIIPKAGVWGLTIFVPNAKEPPPFEEKAAWPLESIVVEQAGLFHFSLVMRDPSGMPIVVDDATGQVIGFEYDIGRRMMYGHGDTRGGSLTVGPFTADNLRAIPIDFTGKQMLAIGDGQIRGEHARVVFGIDGLFRPKAKIHAEFKMIRANVRPLLREAMGDDAPDMDGHLTTTAVIDTDPPNVKIDVSFLLEDAEILLPDDTKAMILTVLKVAPFIELKDHLVRLGALSGKIAVGDGEIVLQDGLYVADKSKGYVDGRMSRTALRGRVHFVPEEGMGGLNWGLLLSGTAKKPKIQLADPAVLDAWTLDGDDTAKEIRQDVKGAQAEARALRREERKRRGGGRDEPDPEPSPDPGAP